MEREGKRVRGHGKEELGERGRRRRGGTERKRIKGVQPLTGGDADDTYCRL